MKKIICLIIAILAITICCGCGASSSKDPFEATHTGTIMLEDGRTISFELYGNAAPKSVENFVGLCKSGFYDGITFHRVVHDFVIQAGDPTATGMGGSDVAITGEFEANGIDNPISHKQGVLSMARNSFDMNSATSQFFICVADCSSSLDGQYAAFGCVTDGMDVVEDISMVNVTPNDKPLADIVIKTININ